jgi:hypothetical protein
MPHSKPDNLKSSARTAQAEQLHSDDALRMEILLRFRRNCPGLGDQALRAAVLTYLIGKRK